MKTTSCVFLLRATRLLLLAAGLLTASHASANPTVTSLGGGNPNVSPKYQGYRDGYTLTNALFRTPSGIVIDNTGRYLYLADRDNNQIRVLDLQLKWTWTLDLVDTNKLGKPINLNLDNNGFLYVLNYGNKTNGTVLTYDVDIFSPTYGYVVLTNAMNLNNAGGMTFDPFGNIYVTVSTNKIIKIAAGTSTVTPVVTVPYAGTSLSGLVYKQNGLLAVCDAGRNGIYLIDPISGNITTNAGFHGAGDFNLNGNDVAPANSAKFNGPTTVLESGDGTLIVADTGNNRVKAVLNGGVVTNLFGIASNYWSSAFPGWVDGTVKIPDSSPANPQSRIPYGLALGSDGTMYDTEDYYHVIRTITGAGLTPPPPPPPGAPASLTLSTNAFEQVVLTWSAVSTATNYIVGRSPSSGGPYTVITTTSSTTYTDSNTVAGSTYYYVVAAYNASGSGPDSPEASITLPYLAVTTPSIGYVTFPPGALGSVFNPVSSSVTFNNEVPIVIEAAAGSQVFYTYSNTVVVTNVANPTSSSASAPMGYTDGLGDVTAYEIATPLPALSIKAIGEQANHPNSAIASAQFLFVVGNPLVSGVNAAAFVVSDVTTGSTLYYTLDGSTPTPTNPTAIELAPLTGTNTLWNLSFSLVTNTLFQIVGYRDNFQSSSVVSNIFTVSAFTPTTISFGFATGQGSSAYIASAGQKYYAPVTLNLVGNPTMYSLQFNLTVTNAGANPGPAIAPNNFQFNSLLEKPIPGISPVVYEYIPPAMFVGIASVPNPITLDGSSDFSSLLTVNTSLNLLGVGWVETAGFTNLYDTTHQTLITYSQAHDTQFLSSGNKVIVGSYGFTVPTTAANGQTYQIQIARPSATSDGIGQPGSSVFISAPTNAGTGAGTINALKQVTIGQFKYIVGSVYPFGWFNAGDFGSSNIVNADVEQVFEAAIYFQNSPVVQAPGSDFLDAMDSSGSIGTLDSNGADANFGFYTNNGAGSFGSNVALFNGNDTTINQDVFGNGFLDVADVYVTFRRSLDPSLTWYRRFWNNGKRVADTGLNVAPHSLVKTITTTKTGVQSKVLTNTNTVTPLVNFTAGDIIGSAGHTISVPITATIVGSYPLRLLMLNLTVTPLDGAPAITSQVTFNQTATVLGAPYTTASQDAANYAAVWLNSTNAGLTGTVTLGYLNVTIPASAGSSAAYAIHFDHASASPNGLASFQKNVLTGILSTSGKTNSSYNDGIPDSWRLRWFGTTNNILSVSNACPSGDGVNNWAKFVAGVDPNAANDFPQVNSTTVPFGYSSAIYWPSVNGKQYVIKYSTSLFGNNWSILSTNTGNGGTMQYNDNSSSTPRFYRVLILQ